MRAHRGVHVESLSKALRPDTAAKLLVLRGRRSFEDEDQGWATDQVLKRLRVLLPDLEVADMALSSYRILSGVSNDPEDTMFAPDDQFPLVLDAMKKSDVVLLSMHERCGMPNADTVRLFERLGEAHEAHAKDKEEPFMFEPKPSAVIGIGGYGVYYASSACASALSRLGLITVAGGIVTYDKDNKGDIEKDKLFGASLDQLAGSIADVCKALSR